MNGSARAREHKGPSNRPPEASRRVRTRLPTERCLPRGVHEWQPVLASTGATSFCTLKSAIRTRDPHSLASTDGASTGTRRVQVTCRHAQVLLSTCGLGRYLPVRMIEINVRLIQDEIFYALTADPCTK